MNSESLDARGIAGITGDIARRLPLYGRDWADGMHPKALAAVAFLFFACIAPAIAFGGLMSRLTGGAIGAIEMIVATSACGVAYASLSGQPLTILGGTGPMLVFTGILYAQCERLGIPFLPTYGWVGLWTAAFTVVLALTGASRLIRLFTRFTDETFAALISVIFVVEAVTNLLRSFPARHVADDSALLGLVLALGTFWFAGALSRLRQRPYLRRTLRELLADFGPALAVIVMVFGRRLLPSVHLASLDVPATFATTSGRPWLVPLGAVPSWVPWAAAGPALLVTLLVFLDQNVTVRIVNSPSNRLQKGAAYHLDLLVCGLLIALTSVFGLPWLVAATVRSVNHVRAVSIVDREGTVHGAIESRVTGVAVHALIGLSLLATPLLREIPMSVLYGLFLYMGITSMGGNQFFERVRLFITDPALYPDVHYVKCVPPRAIHGYTAIQAACLGALWIVKTSAVGILFPLFVGALVPVRSLIGRVFAAEHLAVLDREEEPSDVEDELVGP